MNFYPAILLARRFLMGKSDKTAKGQRYLVGAVLGVALSLVPLVVVLVVSDGMIEGITARYIETGTYHIQVSLPKVAEGGAGTALLDAIRQTPGVIAAYPEIRGPAIALVGSRTSGALIRAVDTGFFGDPGTRKYLGIVAGEADVSRTRDIVLGEALARSLRLKPGDSMSIMTAQAYASGQTGPDLVPKISFFRVRGIVSAGYRDLDSLWAFVNYSSGEKILSPDTMQSFAGVKVGDPYGPGLERVRLGIESSLLRAEKSGTTGPEVRTWPEIEQSLFRSFSTTRGLLVLIMALAVLVAAVNVGSALAMLVLERRQDIAILKSTGASSAFVSRVFIYAGLVSGGIGTAAGLGLGSLVAWRVNDIISTMEKAVNLVSGLVAWIGGRPVSGATFRLLDPSYYLSSIPVRIDPLPLAVIGGISLFLCMVASILPARRASKLSPLEIVRKI